MDRGGPPPPPNPPRTAATGQVFKIMFQDFGKIILKNNLEKKSRLFFKILAKIFLNKIIDFTIYLYGGAKRPPILDLIFKFFEFNSRRSGLEARRTQK